jgi:predicted lipoprotein with Yx(FWY)xxD motif/cytochrome c5
MVRSMRVHPTPDRRKPRAPFAPLHGLLALALVATVASQAWAQVTTTSDIQVREHPEIGAHLVDAHGRTLYVFAEDAPYRATCVDACAEQWPPVTFTGIVPTSTDVPAVLVGAVIRPDGSPQAAFDGLPLYTYAGDDGEGSIEGLGRNGRWSAVAPNGDLISGMAENGADGPAAMSPAEVMEKGQQLYATFCAACHQADGSGNIGPSLRGSANMGDVAFVARQIRDGMSEMPGFGGILSNEDLAAVATYVRGSFGNDFPPLEPADFVR